MRNVILLIGAGLAQGVGRLLGVSAEDTLAISLVAGISAITAFAGQEDDAPLRMLWHITNDPRTLYEINQAMEARNEKRMGIAYGVRALHRLEEAGLIKARWENRSYPLGQPRAQRVYYKAD